MDSFIKKNARSSAMKGKNITKDVFSGESPAPLDIAALDFTTLLETLTTADVNVFLESLDASVDPLALLLKEFLELSKDAVACDARHLASQMLGRLAEQSNPHVQGLVEQARHWRGAAWLAPLSSSLRSLAGPLLRTLHGHREFVGGLVVLPGDEILVSSSEDSSMCVWHLESGALLRNINPSSHPDAHSSAINALALTHDGRRVVSASDDTTLKVWDAHTWEVLHTLRGHSDYVSRVRCTPDGRALSASKDGTLRLWDLDSGQLLQVFEGHEAWVSALDVSPDGRFAVSGAINNTIKVWDLRDLVELAPLFEFEQREFTKLLVGSVFFGLKNESDVGHLNNPRVLLFSPDGQSVVSADEKVIVWDFAKREQKSRSMSQPAGVTVLLPLKGGRALLCGSRNISAWDMETQQQLYRLIDHAEEVTSLALSSDARTLISGSKDKTIKVWDLDRAALVKEYTGHADSVDSLIFSPDGKHLLSASADGEARLWDVETGACAHVLRGHSARYVKALAFTPDSRHAITSSNAGDLKLWDVASGEELTERSAAYEKDFWIDALAVTPDGSAALVGTAGPGLFLWNLERNAGLQAFEGETKQISSVQCSADGRYALTTCYLEDKSGPLQIWDIAKRALVHTLPSDSYAEEPTYFSRLLLLPDQHRVLGGTSKGALHLWDIHSGERLAHWDAHPGCYIRQLYAGPDGQVISCALEEDVTTLRYWNVETQENLRVLTVSRSKPRRLQLTPAAHFALYSATRELVLWDLELDCDLATFYADSELRAYAIAPGEQVFAAGERSGRVHILRLCKAIPRDNLYR